MDYKIVMLGSGGVGKSAITIQFIQQAFVEKYDPTIEDCYRKQFEVNGTARMLDILDTAGQDEYSAMRDSYMRSGKGFVLIFSLTDPSSLSDIIDLHEQLLRSKDREDVPVVLVGNKCDLTEERLVSREEALKVQNHFGSYCKYIEVSAKKNLNVNEIFATIVKLMDSYEKDELNEEEEEENEKEEEEEENKKKKVEKKKKIKKCLIL
ncbi:hypothetical protein ABK040_007564 [Willaertia magna]